ncbi:repetitive organellar protein-like [Schistocerca serialis cubense]|uniref:repetitive organellar protein-like n=1 Tax=Schistocerca serialis cubense TaxID=2023355 RepID=UPI00214E7B22|nr:repetitive organellar protein-like [Schistocerca serialis cubense]
MCIEMWQRDKREREEEKQREKRERDEKKRQPEEEWDEKQALLFSNLKSDMENKFDSMASKLKTDLRTDLKADFKAEVSSVKADVQTKLDSMNNNLKAELKADIGKLVSQVVTVTAEIDSVKRNMKTKFGTVESKIDSVKDELKEGLKHEVDAVETDLRGQIDSKISTVVDQIVKLEDGMKSMADQLQLQVTACQYEVAKTLKKYQVSGNVNKLDNIKKICDKMTELLDDMSKLNIESKIKHGLDTYSTELNKSYEDWVETKDSEISDMVTNELKDAVKSATGTSGDTVCSELGQIRRVFMGDLPEWKRKLDGQIETMNTA